MELLLISALASALVTGYFAGRWHAKRIAASTKPDVEIKGGGGPVEPL